ncbi:MAG: leucine-rich repeat domain-containing protein [Tannerellaceae bacterium]|nr:leucine-rich repeat domain-containing protein [Tannerellaceae bacterium]
MKSWLANQSNITLPEGLKSLGGDAFTRSGLTTITVPGSVSEWGAGVFMYCESLNSFI